MRRRTFLRSTATALAATPLLRDSSFASLYRVATQDPPSLDAITGDGRKITLSGAAIRKLSGEVGRLLLAKSDGYDEARRVLNPTIDRRPALIVQPSTAAEVAAAVGFARESSLLVAVKCGGHSFSGQSTCDGGMQIDLVRLRGVEVDLGRKRATVAGGSLLGAVDRATQPHGLVTPLGTVSHTGVGGLTTGGGFGRVARRFGLALDNVTAAEVVTADGTIRRANPNENADLYWGIRGGGGNFGVVTRFEFALHPMTTRVIAGDLVFPFAKVRDLFELYAEYSGRAPDELYLDFFMSRPPGGADPTCGFSLCYSGPEQEAERVFSVFRPLGTPVADTRKAMEYVDVQRSGDITDPRAMGTYLKSGFTREMTPKLIDAVLHGFEGHPSRATQVFTQICGGAIGRVPTEATAFAHRYAKQNLFAAVAWPAAADGAAPIKWARQYWATIEPHTGGFYSNEVIGDEGKGVVNANYGVNYPRLAALKTKYDPTNLFRLNANITPGG